MVVRRSVDPRLVHIIWDGVRFITHQRQFVNLNRLSRYVERAASISLDQAEEFIEKCVKEGVLIISNKKGGEPIQCYKVPSTNDQPIDDGHDWYCFECHLSGNVECCITCHRVFHIDCSQKFTDSTFNISINNEKNQSLNETTQTENKAETKAETSQENGLVKSQKIDTETLEESTPKLKIPETETNTNSKIDNDDTLHKCSICKMIAEDIDFNIDPKDLNYLFKYLFNRIRNWLPQHITQQISLPPPPVWYIEGDEQWRSQHMLFKHIDIRFMEIKAQRQEYTKLADLKADVLSVCHNVAVYHGVDSTEYQAALYMLRDTCYDLLEIKQCVECYRQSNEKLNSNWFCVPCKPPHELVWAKQRGFCFWPAKLLVRKPDGSCDVRFFGAKYMRATVPSNCVKHIDTPEKDLSVKHSVTFNKAVDELQLHQKWLQNPEEVEAYYKLSNLKRSKSLTPNKPKTYLKKPKKKKKSDSEDSFLDIYEFSDSPTETSVSSIHLNKQKRKIGRPKKVTPDEVKTEETTSAKKKSKYEDLRHTIRECSVRVTRSNTQAVEKMSTSSEDVVIVDIEGNKNDGFEEDTVLSCSQDDLISSTQDIRSPNVGETSSRQKVNSSPLMSTLDRHYSEGCEGLRKQLDACRNKDELIHLACDAFRTLEESHAAAISELKKKQWCYNCEQEAIYHCCWNTSYCSTLCQQQHWQAEHKKACRRKR